MICDIAQRIFRSDQAIADECLAPPPYLRLIRKFYPHFELSITGEQ